LGLRLETLNHFPVPAKTREGFPLEQSCLNCALAALVRDDVITRDGNRYAVVDSLLREWVARRTY
jgi:hypothetical protein